MIPIELGLGQLTDEFSLTQEQVNGLCEYSVKEITAAFAQRWADTANRGLGGTRTQYVDSLVVREEGRFAGSVVLTGMLPNMLESGAAPFDMKPGFASSSKRTPVVRKLPGGKEETGWYLTIPYRMATPGALGENALFASVMPSAVHKAVLDQDQDLGMSKGLMEGNIPSEYRAPTTRAQVTVRSRVFEEYRSQTSIYAGLKHSTRTHGQYVSFRRVSDISDENSWVHTGLNARGFAEKALGALDIPHEADKAIDTYLANQGF